jgi:hypothetical protein
MKSCRPLLTLLSLLALGSTALAQSPAAARPVSDAPRTQTYRGWIAGTSAAALGLYVLGGLSEGENGRDTELSGPLFAAGMGGFVLSGPIVHAAHGNWVRAGGSLALRIGLPTLGMMAGFASAECSDDEIVCGGDRIGPGWIIGAAVAAILDASFLAKKTERRKSPRVLPYASAKRGGGALGLTGYF